MASGMPLTDIEFREAMDRLRILDEADDDRLGQLDAEQTAIDLERAHLRGMKAGRAQATRLLTANPDMAGVSLAPTTHRPADTLERIDTPPRPRNWMVLELYHELLANHPGETTRTRLRQVSTADWVSVKSKLANLRNRKPYPITCEPNAATVMLTEYGEQVAALALNAALPWKP